MKQTIANLCTRCETRFDKWISYHNHVVANTCCRKIVPTRTTGRSVAQIVADYENNQLKGALI